MTYDIFPMQNLFGIVVHQCAVGLFVDFRGQRIHMKRSNAIKRQGYGLFGKDVCCKLLCLFNDQPHCGSSRHTIKCFIFVMSGVMVRDIIGNISTILANPVLTCVVQFSCFQSIEKGGRRFRLTHRSGNKFSSYAITKLCRVVEDRRLFLLSCASTACAKPQ